MKVNVKFGSSHHSPTMCVFDLAGHADVDTLKYAIITDIQSPWKGRDNNVIVVKEGDTHVVGGLADEADLVEGATYHAILTLDQYAGGWLT